MLASIILAREDEVKCLHFSIDYYGMIFRATQSVELFCAYEEHDEVYSLAEENLQVYNYIKLIYEIFKEQKTYE